jgi:POT family proton-dependent oligopeptide transporter
MKTFFGEPRGLGYLALTELWERFSYYGMSGLLVLFMTDSLLRPDRITHIAGFAGFRGWVEALTGPLSAQALALMIFGLYSGFMYLTPVLGGMVGDRLLGRRRTVVIGAILLSMGHFAMAFDASFLVALGLLIIGCGCLKGNISAQVGALYSPEDDTGRTRGFAIFSGWIVVGAFLGPLLCGVLAQNLGWHVAFGAAGVFMLVGLATYLVGMRQLAPDPPRRDQTKDTVPLSRDEWQTVAAVLGIIAITVFQTIAIDQLDSVGLIWIRDSVDLSTPLGRVPAAWFNSIGAFSNIVAIPPLIALWRWQATRGCEPSDIGKIGIGAAITAGSVLLLASASAAADAGRVSILWPILTYTGYGIAFIYYWPTLLAFVSRKAPARVNATMLGVAFLSLFIGSIIAGWIGAYYERMSHTTFWLIDAAIAACGALLVLFVRRPLHRLELQEHP